MPYSLNTDFRTGVDRRRSISAAPAGTIYTLVNGHITRGGDIERRKTFVPKHDLPPNTFGCARASGSLYVFGSIATPPGLPAGVQYQRLQHPDGELMSNIIDVDTYSGKLYVIAQFDDGSIYHFYDGERVSSLDSGVVRSAMTDNAGIASHLNGLIDTDPAYTPSVVSNVITIAAAVPGTPFTISTSTENVAGGTDDQTAVVANTVANVAGVTEVRSTAHLTVTGGTASAGVNKLSSVKINGVEILNVAVDWTTSYSATATAIAAQINSYNSTPEYTATASGPIVTISAAAGTGAGPNGFAVAATVGGDLTVSADSTMAGGVTAVSAVAQQATVTIGGTFEVGDKFTVTIDAKNFGFSGSTAIQGTSCMTAEEKMYVTAASLLEFSGVAVPNDFDPVTATGAGNINMANHDSGSEELVGLELYQKNLAVVARRTIQIWSIAADPAQNRKIQVLKKTGSRSRKSIRAFGDNDVMYLSDSGIRSLRSREVSDLAAVFDIGTLIDPLVLSHVKTLTDDQIEGAVSVIEPIDGRYWLALGNKIFVYTNFPSVKIAAWSVYETDFAQIDALVDLNDRIYARVGDTIYLYGGDDNETYTDGDVDVQLPFISSDKPADYKDITGFDADLEGVWSVEFLVDPRDLTQVVNIGILEGITYNDGDIGAVGRVTHVAPHLTCNTPGYAKISNIAVHFEKAFQSN